METVSCRHQYTQQKTGDAEKRIAMRSAVSEDLACDSTADPFLVRSGSKTTVHGIERALQTPRVLESAGDVVSYLLALLENYTTRTFVSPLKDVARQASAPPRHDIPLQFVKSG